MMNRQRQYWVLSPNVMNQEKTVGDWKKEILRARAAIIGWPPNDYDHGRQMGPKFAGKTDRSVQVGDIILIVRRHNWAPDIVGFGVVKGEFRADRLPPSDDEVYLRDLDPFKPCDRAPQGIPLLDILPRNRALVQRHPDSKKKDAAWRVCKWMERRLGLEDREVDNDDVTESDLPESTTFGYKVRTPEQVTRAQRREAKLLKDYKQWLEKQGRHLSTVKYSKLQCDAWEEERQNLIEAKGSTSREDIRMAVGQLLDYRFQGRKKFKHPHLTILLPKEPLPANRIKWLEPLDINVICRSGRSFVDNANGQFT